MISKIFFMDGYGLYVWSAFLFTLASFLILYYLTKFQLVKEEKRFAKKFGLLDKDKIKLANVQITNREIIANTLSSKI